jgi:hypothetical protein
MAAALSHPGWRSLAAEAFAVFAGPTAWLTQLVVGYALTGYACYPRHVWQADVMRGWAAARPAALAMNVTALVVAALALWAARRLWAAGATASADSRRRRFSGLCGLLSSGVFLAANLANTAPLLGAPTC